MNRLFVLMGYPGCGKSFFISQIRLKPTDLVLSSDALREELFGFRDQTRNDELFTELYKRVTEHSEIGDTYIDATNLTRKDRMRIVERFKKLYELNIICFLRPIDELIEVNNQRKDTKEYIPEDIFKKILGRFQLPTYDEGWKSINFKINTTKENMEDALFDYKNIEDKPHNNPHHPETIKEHIDYCVNYCKDNDKVPILTELSAYHDLGKFFVQTYNEEKGYSQTIGHASLSAYIYLVDASIKYLVAYNKQQNIEGNTFNRTFDIYGMSNIKSILLMYYLIYYHDQPYACPDRESLLKSLSKPSKPLHFLEKENILYIDLITDLLIGFNQIDRLREGDTDE